ncbi:MAG: hypothetical protein F6K36_01930 [Symploca sp. SIO3C6]|nr:hypothetical protein [Symploca sp. SIO3C6]
MTWRRADAPDTGQKSIKTIIEINNCLWSNPYPRKSPYLRFPVSGIFSLMT